MTLVSTNEVQNSTTKSAENGQNLSGMGISALIVESKGSSASFAVIRKELRRHREKKSSFGRCLNSVVLQQMLDIETRGSSYVMDAIDEKPKDTCRNVSKRIWVEILLLFLSLL